MTLIFWQNIISPHQAPFLRALAGMGHEVTVVAPEIMTADRLAMGWQTPDLGAARIIIAPSANTIRQVIESGSTETIHVMAGARWTPLGQQATELCLSLRRRMGVLTEAPDPRGMAGFARRLKYAGERFTQGWHYDFILAMGEMGVRWFQSCGYPPARLFPFAYVTDPTAPSDEPRATSSDQTSDVRCQDSDFRPPTSGSPIPARCSVLFVGRLVSLKGVDLLLRALASVKLPHTKLGLVGDGPEAAALRSLAGALGISAQVEWLGSKCSSEIPALMSGADVLVLPSHKDGWGAVVNESLMAGTPVICSTACGAADLIRQPWLGTVFPVGNVRELAAALQQWSTQGSRTAAERQRIQAWSRCVEGKSVARYFEAVMNHVYDDAARPTAPWRQVDDELTQIGRLLGSMINRHESFCFLST